jgi:aminoacrylate hydrolase
MKVISLRDEARIGVEAAGDGQAIVFVSGLGGTAGFWQPLVTALAADVHAIRFDQRGIGVSERGLLPVTIPSLAEDTWEIVDALGIECFILCGHSTGGAIVQEMELMRPGQASGLILSGTWAGPNMFMKQMFQIRLELLAKAPERYPELSALLGSPPRWLRDNPGSLRQATGLHPGAEEAAIIKERIEALLAHDCRERLAAITAPVLIVGAEDDMIVPAYLQEELASMLPHARLDVFERGGHFFPVTRAEDTACLLRQWMVGQVA